MLELLINPCIKSANSKGVIAEKTPKTVAKTLLLVLAFLINLL